MVTKLLTLEEDEPSQLWQPNPDRDGKPNPQRLALESEADVLGYGGQSGGGKTELLLGLSLQHKYSVIFRRVFPSLRGLIERSREVFNPGGDERRRDSFNEQLHRWQFEDGRQLEFEACQYEKDREKQRGRPRDFHGFDEATEFTRSQIEFITAWNRSTDPSQRCRVVLTFNPPADEGGTWVIDFFLPWLAHLHPDQFQHPNPAKPGDLRWYATVDGKETECADGKSFEHKGETIYPRSRTFIPAALSDNPPLEKTGYRAVLQSLPEPLRSQLLHGDFSAATEADPWQVIPTVWVRLAQQRWLERVKPTVWVEQDNGEFVEEDVSLSGVGVDPSRGGRDKTAIVKRYDNWFAPPLTYPGVQVQDGPTVALLVKEAIGEDEPGYINIDVIGIGSSAYDSLTPMYYDTTNPINASLASGYRDRSGKLKMRNIRAEYHWRMREALDPEHGDDLALPPGNEIVADLCAARYKLTTAGIVIEEKEKIKERIGRSPDVGEAIMLAHLDNALTGQLVF
jgi:hypothetical protein